MKRLKNVQGQKKYTIYLNLVLIDIGEMELEEFLEDLGKIFEAIKRLTMRKIISQNIVFDSSMDTGGKGL